MPRCTYETSTSLTFDDLQVKLRQLELMWQGISVEQRQAAIIAAHNQEPTFPASSCVMASECRESITTTATMHSIDATSHLEERYADPHDSRDDLESQDPLDRSHREPEHCEMADIGSTKATAPEYAGDESVAFLREANRKFSRSINDIMREVRSL